MLNTFVFAATMVTITALGIAFLSSVITEGIVEVRRTTEQDRRHRIQARIHPRDAYGRCNRRAELANLF